MSESRDSGLSARTRASLQGSEYDFLLVQLSGVTVLKFQMRRSITQIMANIFKNYFLCDANCVVGHV